MKQAVCTIGYEGASLEEFLAALRRAGVEVLVDVREVPLSRKRGFSKTALQLAIRQAGLEYLHLRALGDPKPGRDAARAGNLGLFRRIFSAQLATEAARQELEVAAKLVKHRRACLMCFEENHEHCHRSIVATRIKDMTGAEVENLKVTKARNHGAAAHHRAA